MRLWKLSPRDFTQTGTPPPAARPIHAERYRQYPRELFYTAPARLRRTQPLPPIPRAWYSASIPEFLVAGTEKVLGSLTANLAELLTGLLCDGRALIAVAEFLDGRYVQFWVQPTGRVVAEVMSSAATEDQRELTDDEVEILRQVGFLEPHLPEHPECPNWWCGATDATSLEALLRRVNVAIEDVLHEHPANVVEVRTWVAHYQRSDHEPRTYFRELVSPSR